MVKHLHTDHWLLWLLFAQFCETFQQRWIHNLGKVVTGCLSCRDWLHYCYRTKKTNKYRFTASFPGQPR